jgi:hypothetical protein
MNSGEATATGSAFVGTSDANDSVFANAVASANGGNASSLANVTLNGEALDSEDDVTDSGVANAISNTVGADSTAVSTAETMICGVGAVCTGQAGNDTHGLSNSAANAINGGTATSNSLAVSQSGAVADAISSSTASNGASATSQSAAFGLGRNNTDGVEGEGSADAQARSITQATDEGSNAYAGSIAASTQAGANALSISQAANGATAMSNTLASDTATSNGTGAGISVAGGCQIGVGCGFAFAQTNVNPNGSDTSSSIAFAISQSGATSGGVASVAESSAAGGSLEVGSTSSTVPGVGGSFSFTNNTGDAATIAAVGMLPGTTPTSGSIVPFP